MTITDLNLPGQHAYRGLLDHLHQASFALSEDAMLALLELVNQELSELLMDVHNGKSARNRIFALRLCAAPVTHPPIKPAPVPGYVCGPCNAQ